MADGNVASLKKTHGMVLTNKLVGETLDDAFPPIDPAVEPLGNRVLIQIRAPKTMHGKIILTDTSRDTEKWNTQIGKVIALGPTAYKNLRDLTPWPEGSHVVPGDYVRIGKYGGDRFEVKKPNQENALFVLMLDHEMIAKVTGDPMSIVAFV